MTKTVYDYRILKWTSKNKMSDSDPKRASEDEIPILDAQSIVSNYDISLLAKSVRKACQNMGFFYVKNHGISQTIIDDAFDAPKKFFSEPIERKMLVSKDKFHRGYLPIGTTRYPGKAADLKDSFDVGIEPVSYTHLTLPTNREV